MKQLCSEMLQVQALPGQAQVHPALGDKTLLQQRSTHSRTTAWVIAAQIQPLAKQQVPPHLLQAASKNLTLEMTAICSQGFGLAEIPINPSVSSAAGWSLQLAPGLLLCICIFLLLLSHIIHRTMVWLVCRGLCQLVQKVVGVWEATPPEYNL